MNAVKTINLKGLEHAQREALIFPTIQGLKLNESAKLIVEFNPLPLVYLFKAGGELDVVYEKEGPDEWILNVKRTVPAQDQRAHLKSLLQELKQGEVSAQAKEKAKEFFQAVDAKTLGDLEQELIREGVSHDEIRQSLCDVHLEVMKDALVANHIEVEAPHPVHTLMEEHRVIVSSLQELGAITDRLKGLNDFSSLGNDIVKLQGISHHLVEAENHHLREEEVLFLMLEKHNVVEPPAIMKLDHVEFRKRKRELYQLAHNYRDYDFGVFKSRVIELGEYLHRELGSHIFKEDNILYQIALQVLTPEEWEEVKVGCDKIGYCCFTPGDHKKNGKTVELDLRPLPSYQRHDKIFATWEALQPGEALRIINDHDPKPLRYQFEAEFAGRHIWEYEQTGPRDWAVKIIKKG